MPHMPTYLDVCFCAKFISFHCDQFKILCVPLMLVLYVCVCVFIMYWWWWWCGWNARMFEERIMAEWLGRFPVVMDGRRNERRYAVVHRWIAWKCWRVHFHEHISDSEAGRRFVGKETGVGQHGIIYILAHARHICNCSHTYRMTNNWYKLVTYETNAHLGWLTLIAACKCAHSQSCLRANRLWCESKKFYIRLPGSLIMSPIFR